MSRRPGSASVERIARTVGLGAGGYERGESPPIVMITAYDAISASIAEAAGVDIILVGDSAATTILGYETTRSVSVEEMLMLTRAARRGAPETVILGDLPFGSYEGGNRAAVDVARQFVHAGADLVKLEGANEMVQRLRAIVDAGIPAVGHVGLLPQGARTRDELRAQGRTATEALRILEDAVELDQAGASLIVVEAVPSIVARAVQGCVRVPVIGIGAGSDIGGQVLVYPDMLGLTSGKVPRFVRRYAELRATWTNAIHAYSDDVRTHAFPSQAEEYGMPEAEVAAFEQMLHERHPTASR